jgi:hypothetical protein
VAREGGEMNINNDLKLKLYAEDYIRARILEADNYRMLNQLRRHPKSGALHPVHTMLGHLGRILIIIGERLVVYELSSAP